MKAVILTDGKAGHESQSKALARALGLEPEIVRVRFRSPLCKLLSYALDRLGIRSLSLLEFPDGPAPDAGLYIGTGSGTFYAVKALAAAARHRGRSAKCAAVLFPRGYHLPSFDCIVAPVFDNLPNLPNVVPVPVNLVAADEEYYRAGVETFRERHAASPRPAAAVVVGGPNARAQMSPDWMRTQLERIFEETEGCERWVTTSRRTPPAVEAVIDSFPFDYKLVYSRDHFNPIPAFVSLAKRLYVTADSTGMLSEACSFGSAEVYALDNLGGGRHKFRRFLDALSSGGYLGPTARKANLAAQFATAKRLCGLEE